MGNRQKPYGKCNTKPCVPFKSGYINHEGFIVKKYNLKKTSITDYHMASSSIITSEMALINWVPPPVGTLKVNVHAAAFAHPIPNGNIIGIGVVLRTSDGNLMNCVAGTIPGLTPLVLNCGQFKWD